MQNESQLSKEILDCFVVVNTDQMGNARYDIDFNKLSKEFATARAEGATEERNKTRRAYCEVCRVFINVDTGERIDHAE